ncbi:DinB family protein [Gayadomonas joobiniege]|uniref:DinB family protein n=1 Tax=Gayadomonas joobiniege TaxID=1234606 RepID=UPI000363D5B8|nr:DinB family protein [Gayadomonas joobiniege]
MYQLLANYNRQMNEKIYRAALNLPESEVCMDRGAFFGSIFDTLNHIYVGDLVWLKRFSQGNLGLKSLLPMADLPQPIGLSARMADSLAELSEHRGKLDQIIIEFVNELRPEMLTRKLVYQNTKGVEFEKDFAALVLHMFNHQTHHRGQVTTLLNQIGIDVGVTDLLECIP